MPYTSTPPGVCSASNTVTEKPALARSPAQVRPEGPEPTTAMRMPFPAGRAALASDCAWRSATYLSSLPIPTGSPFMPRTQRLSHCVSCGQTRPHTAGRLESFDITSYAPSMSPSRNLAIKSGILIPTGHPPTQAGDLHPRQRAASFAAASSEYPHATSSNVRARTVGSSTGIGVFFASIFIFAISQPSAFPKRSQSRAYACRSASRYIPPRSIASSKSTA